MVARIPEFAAMVAPPACPAGPAADAPSDAERLEAAVDQAIAACGGDTRAAVRALILANDFLEQELREAAAAVSRGYARGRFVPSPSLPETAAKS